MQETNKVTSAINLTVHNSYIVFLSLRYYIIRVSFIKDIMYTIAIFFSAVVNVLVYCKLIICLLNKMQGVQ